MTLPFNPLRAAELARQALDDDSKMTPGPWSYCGASDGECQCGLVWAGHGNDTVARTYSAENDTHGRVEDGHGIARTRNALREMAEQLEAAVERITQLEANAISMREYRFALEGIATDGSGNPVEKAGKP